MRKGDWDSRDIDQDRFIDLTKAKDEVLHVYLLEGDPNIYYNEDDVDLRPRLSSATFTSIKKGYSNSTNSIHFNRWNRNKR